MSRFEPGMESMVDMFIYESTSLLEQLDQIMIKTESNNKFDEEDINEIFRIMHTIKGSSAMMGLNNMSTLAHSIEDMFFIIREEKPVIDSVETLYDLVFSSSDLLKAEIDSLQDDDSEPTDFTDQINKIENFVTYLKTGKMPDDTKEAGANNPPADAGADSKDASENKTETMSAALKIRVFFEDNCEMENLRALLLANKISEYCTELSYEPKNIETDSSTSKIINEKGFLLTIKAPEESYQHIYREIEDSIDVKSYETVEDDGDHAEKEVHDEKTAPETQESKPADDAQQAVKQENLTPAAEPKPQQPQAQPAKNAPAAQSQEEINNKLAQKNKHVSKGKQSLISVNLNKLDQLLDMVGEIVIAEAMVTSNPDLKGLKLENFQKATRELRKLTDELQDIVMSIRMVPLSGVFNKMTRIVRDMKVKLNKDVNLVFEGEETEVDKSIIDNLNDPLMHMVRNSMDHGIESSQEERIARGKPAQGTITLAAYNSSGEVIIVVSDDGAGIDCQRVMEKAKANGLLTKPEEEYTEKEIFNMVMLPGFSTNTEVTEYSGRGVGMDVVRQSIEKIGGTVSVDSKWGEGTNFIIKIPLSLAIVDGIEVSVGSSIFTIPINSIKEFIKLKENQLFYDTSKKEIVKIRNKCYPLIRLHEFYGLEPASDNIYDGVVVLVEAEGKSACILVDELIGEQQVVVKPFSPMFNRYNIKQQGMSGCTILGDGSITIILDVGNIINDN
ncbi:chemotaxis protein CheW [Porcipelethomonas sp.]|uniref:chemotaxis protein CheW n=1 Tax=Porcipelethomonas sp. TaxID=2981675 RepID=UPI003EF5AAD2